MHKSTRIFWLCLLLFAFSHVATVSAAETDTLPAMDFSGIDFKNGYLRVSVKDQKFQNVLNEIANKAGIKIAINDTTDEDLTINFGYLTLEKGLKQLLRGRSYVFFYDSGEANRSSRLMKVVVFPKPGGWTAAGSEGLARDRLPEQAQQDMNNLKANPIPDNLKDNLKELLPNFPGNDADLNKQIKAAMEKIQEMDLLKDIEKLEDVETREKIIKALSGIQDQMK